MSLPFIKQQQLLIYLHHLSFPSIHTYCKVLFYKTTEKILQISLESIQKDLITINLVIRSFIT